MARLIDRYPHLAADPRVPVGEGEPQLIDAEHSRMMRQHVQLYLNEGEENLIRRIRMADYQGAGRQFEQLKAQRMAEDSAVIRQLNEEGPGT